MMLFFRPRVLPVFIVFLLSLLVVWSSASQAVADAPYHGNSNTRKFHTAGCQYFDCPHCTVEFRTREAAIEAGYVPCKICDP